MFVTLDCSVVTAMPHILCFMTNKLIDWLIDWKTELNWNLSSVQLRLKSVENDTTVALHEVYQAKELNWTELQCVNAIQFISVQFISFALYEPSVSVQTVLVRDCRRRRCLCRVVSAYSSATVRRRAPSRWRYWRCERPAAARRLRPGPDSDERTAKLLSSSAVDQRAPFPRSRDVAWRSVDVPARRRSAQSTSSTSRQWRHPQAPARTCCIVKMKIFIHKHC